MALSEERAQPREILSLPYIEDLASLCKASLKLKKIQQSEEIRSSDEKMVVVIITVI